VKYCCTRTASLLFACAAFATSAHAAESLGVPQYKAGETARVEVVAAVGFVAIDQEKTAELRLKGGERVPVIYRFDTNAAAAALANLQDAFTSNRQYFVVRLQSRFNRQVLDDRELSGDRFAKFLSSYQSTHRAFPLSSNLACAWAKGESDSEWTLAFEDKLRNAMAHFIRPEDRPAEAKIGWQVKLVPSDASSALSMAQVERTRAVARSNVIALLKFRSEFAKQFAPEEKYVVRFLSAFIQPTCIPEGELTRELREKQMAGLSSVTRYEPGDVIVRPGDLVSTATKAALDEYRAKLAMLRGPAAAPSATLVAAPIPARPITPWIWGGSALFAAAGAVFFYRARRRRQTAALALVPDSLGQDAVAALRDDPVIRDRLLAHLTRLMGQSIVRRLFAQRGQLLATQHAATAQTTEIEQRLEKVQSDMQERFTAYEQRIEELEKELAAAEEQNRDLIRVKIAIAKQELEAERARRRIDLN
jgi:hypothetical protein